MASAAVAQEILEQGINRLSARQAVIIGGAALSLLLAFSTFTGLSEARMAIVDDGRQAVSEQLSLDASLLNRAARSGIDVSGLTPLAQEVQKRLAGARSPQEIASALIEARAIGQSIGKQIQQVGEEQQRIGADAAALLASNAAPDAMRAEGFKTLADGNNTGTIVALLRMPGWSRLTDGLVTASIDLSSQQPTDIARGVAAAHEYAGELGAMQSSFKGKLITLSITAQQLWAYQDGKLLQSTLVTTGRPELPTDIGAMKVIWKDSPWKMHSPWPRNSPYWYPDTTVRQVLWFTNTGEGLHDAYWEPSSDYGPGSQNGRSASHGCVHIPDAAERFLFDWAPIGTPVIVYPGDSTPVADQLKQVTVDENGVPLTGARGA